MFFNKLILSIFLCFSLIACSTVHKSPGYVTRDSIVIKKTQTMENNFLLINPVALIQKTSCELAPRILDTRYRRYVINPACNRYPFYNMLFLWSLKSHQTPAEILSNTRYEYTNVKKQIIFSKNGVVSISTRSEKDNCYFLTDAKKNLVSIRSSESNPYLFSNPFKSIQLAEIKNKQQIYQAQVKLNNIDKQLLTIDKVLRNSPSWTGKSCKQTVATRLPLKPDAISLSKTRIQANSYCAEIATKRENLIHVSESITAMSNKNILRNWHEWRASRIKFRTCTKVSLNQVSRLMTSKCKRSGSNTSKFCTQNFVQSCINRSISQCNEEITKWQKQVDSILQNQKKTNRSCSQNLFVAKQLKLKKSSFETELKQIKLKNKNQTAPSKVSLEKAICER